MAAALFLGLFQAAFLVWRFEALVTPEMAHIVSRVAVFVGFATVLVLTPVVLLLRRWHPAWRSGEHLRADWAVRFPLSAAPAAFMLAETWAAGPLVPAGLRTGLAGVLALGAGAAALWVRPSARALRVGAGLGVLLLVAAALPSGSRSTSAPPAREARPPAAAAGRPDVVLVTIDTLRADRVGAYAPGPSLTPHIDRLAAEGVRFTRAVAASSWTVPSVASLLTGLPAERHGAGHPLVPGSAFLRSGLERRHDSLAETFAAAGYRTRAVVANAFLTPELGFDQGFDEFVNPLTRAMGASLLLELPLTRALLSFTRPQAWGDYRAQGLSDQALTWLEAEPAAPLFLWVHYLEPHAPYRADPSRLELVSMATLLSSRPDVQDDGTTVGEVFAGIHAVRSGTWRLGPRDRRRIVEYYDRGVTYVDRHVGRLLEAVRARQARRPTLLALTSDHGEEFWEHGHFEHGHDFYREITRVPLIFWGPGRVPAGASADDVAGLVDVGATLVELAGLPARAHPAADEGRSLSAAWSSAGPGLPARPRFAGGNLYDLPAVLVEEGPWRYLLRANQTEELYDASADPQELSNLAARHADVAARLRALLGPRLDVFLKAETGDPSELSAQTLKALQSLGYVN